MTSRRPHKMGSPNQGSIQRGRDITEDVGRSCRAPAGPVAPPGAVLSRDIFKSVHMSIWREASAWGAADPRDKRAAFVAGGRGHGGGASPEIEESLCRTVVALSAQQAAARIVRSCSLLRILLWSKCTKKKTTHRKMNAKILVYAVALCFWIGYSKSTFSSLSNPGLKLPPFWRTQPISHTVQIYS